MVKSVLLSLNSFCFIFFSVLHFFLSIAMLKIFHLVFMLIITLAKFRWMLSGQSYYNFWWFHYVNVFQIPKTGLFAITWILTAHWWLVPTQVMEVATLQIWHIFKWQVINLKISVNFWSMLLDSTMFMKSSHSTERVVYKKRIIKNVESEVTVATTYHSSLSYTVAITYHSFITGTETTSNSK